MFLREVQVAWPEAYPFMDGKSKQMAERLGLSRDASRLARQVKGKPTFVRLVDGLVRASFDP